MAATVEYYDELIDAIVVPESFSFLVVAGASRDAVAHALEVDLHDPVAHPWDDKRDAEYAAWALVEIDGGVLGIEYSGCADPGSEALTTMTKGGAAAAVVRTDDEEEHLRFGCARDAVLLFDAPDFRSLDDADPVPPELRPLLAQGSDADGLALALALTEVVTGLELTPKQTMLFSTAQFFRGPPTR
ncbi:hypothetical protein DJ010_19430 [Nocardioides silvaticus]|uniref:Uncharacterized protein n=1 Tax=Nocardioides silvaticus TaxID=2201891 RepID=A0A316TAA3_9ACTN|nr:hypothetical protein [Nocardioides silvaticus]PWN01330.1 hypothetical protein DJ010_19430 [Nocardioides silvaticus]